MDQEIETYLPGIVRPIESILAGLDGLSVEQLNWRPGVPDANSAWVVATHIVSSVEEALLHYIGGAEVARNREAEFASRITDISDVDRLKSRWDAIADALPAALGSVTSADLARTRSHPFFGDVPGQVILREAVGHASGHAQEALLTCKLAGAAS